MADKSMVIEVRNAESIEFSQLPAAESQDVPRERVPDPSIARISLLMPAELRDQLETLAERERRSLSSQIIVLIERGLSTPSK